MAEKIEFNITPQIEMLKKDLLKAEQKDLIWDYMDTTLTITVNGEEYLYIEDFPIAELLGQVLLWKGEEGDFYYNSLETDENPMISFREISGKYKISSPWESFKCSEDFTKEELLQILNLITSEN